MVSHKIWLTVSHSDNLSRTKKMPRLGHNWGTVVAGMLGVRFEHGRGTVDSPAVRTFNWLGQAWSKLGA